MRIASFSAVAAITACVGTLAATTAGCAGDISTAASSSGAAGGGGQATGGGSQASGGSVSSGTGGQSSCAGTRIGARCLVTLATGQQGPTHIAVDANNVYWTMPTAVMKCPVTGGAMATKLARGGAIGPVAFDSEHVYWTDYANGQMNSVARCTFAGAGGSTQTLWSYTISVSGVAAPGIGVDSANVYSTEYASDYEGDVRSCAVTGCTAGTGALPGRDAGAWGVALDTDNIYWTQYYPPLAGNPAFGIVSTCPKAGCQKPRRLVHGLQAPRELAVDATHVYWADHDARAIAKCGLAGCGASPTTLAHSNFLEAEIEHLAIDDEAVYWTDAAQGVMKCAKSGCAMMPTVLAPDQPQPAGIAVDATSVYWVNTGDGTVMKLTPK